MSEPEQTRRSFLQTVGGSFVAALAGKKINAAPVPKDPFSISESDRKCMRKAVCESSTHCSKWKHIEFNDIPGQEKVYQFGTDTYLMSAQDRIEKALNKQGIDEHRFQIQKYVQKPCEITVDGQLHKATHWLAVLKDEKGNQLNIDYIWVEQGNVHKREIVHFIPAAALRRKVPEIIDVVDETKDNNIASQYSRKRLVLQDRRQASFQEGHCTSKGEWLGKQSYKDFSLDAVVRKAVQISRD